MIEDGLYQHLRQVPGIAALGDRIYPHQAPEGTPMPLVTYEREGPGNIDSLDGSAGLSSPTFRIIAWSTDYNQAKDLAEAIRLSLLAVRRATWGADRVYAIQMAGGDDVASMVPTQYPVTRSYTIWHRESVQETP